MIKRCLLWLLLTACAACAQDGAEIYQNRCARCHDMPAERVPPVAALRQMSSDTILRALNDGPMKMQARSLSAAERSAVALYLAKPTSATSAPAQTGLCSAPSAPVGASVGSWSGWGRDSSNTRFQDAQGAGLAAADVPRLKLKWAFALDEGIDARSQPGVARGRLYVGSQSGVYALDAGTGCAYWHFTTAAAVRGAPVTGSAGAQELVYFSDLSANVYAVDALTGKLLWKSHPDAHPTALLTGAPLLRASVLYVPVASFEEVAPFNPAYECCTFRGSVVALDAVTGKQIWKTYTIAEAAAPTIKSKAGVQQKGPSGAAIWSAPTFDEQQNRIYVATGDNYSDPPTKTSDAVIALDAQTGRVVWSRQITANDAYNGGCDLPGKPGCPAADGGDFDFGQPPILVKLAGARRALVIGQKSGMAHALDPDREGAVLWETRVAHGGRLGGIQWGSAADRENMYLPVSDLALRAVPDGKSFRMETVPDQGGGLVALRLATGEKVWAAKPAVCGDRKNCSPAQSAPASVIPGVVFSGALDGHIRAYASSSGEIVWDQDTAREYETVNGKKAHGGSLDCAGPVVVGGTLYVASGYGQWGGMPGNVLLAFSVDGR